MQSDDQATSLTQNGAENGTKNDLVFYNMISNREVVNEPRTQT
jgi:hypothetical protein